MLILLSKVLAQELFPTNYLKLNSRYGHFYIVIFVQLGYISTYVLYLWVAMWKLKLEITVVDTAIPVIAASFSVMYRAAGLFLHLFSTSGIQSTLSSLPRNTKVFSN